MINDDFGKKFLFYERNSYIINRLCNSAFVFLYSFFNTSGLIWISAYTAVKAFLSSSNLINRSLLENYIVIWRWRLDVLPSPLWFYSPVGKDVFKWYFVSYWRSPTLLDSCISGVSPFTAFTTELLPLAFMVIFIFRTNHWDGLIDQLDHQHWPLCWLSRSHCPWIPRFSRYLKNFRIQTNYSL